MRSSRCSDRIAGAFRGAAGCIGLLLMMGVMVSGAPRAEAASLSELETGRIGVIALDAPQETGMMGLSDDQLADVSAGDFQTMLKDFNVNISDNQAGAFTLDIGQTAFGGANGIFTTLQAVNSAVDLTVIVNIYLGSQQ